MDTYKKLCGILFHYLLTINLYIFYLLQPKLKFNKPIDEILNLKSLSKEASFSYFKNDKLVVATNYIKSDSTYFTSTFYILNIIAIAISKFIFYDSTPITNNFEQNLSNSYTFFYSLVYPKPGIPKNLVIAKKKMIYWQH